MFSLFSFFMVGVVDERAGGVFQPDWKDRAVDLHTQFIAKNLSPGGSADMLAATLFAGRLLHSHGTCRADLKDGSL